MKSPPFWSKLNIGRAGCLVASADDVIDGLDTGLFAPGDVVHPNDAEDLTELLLRREADAEDLRSDNVRVIIEGFELTACKIWQEQSIDLWVIRKEASDLNAVSLNLCGNCHMCTIHGTTSSQKYGFRLLAKL